MGFQDKSALSCLVLTLKDSFTPLTPPLGTCKINSKVERGGERGREREGGRGREGEGGREERVRERGERETDRQTDRQTDRETETDRAKSRGRKICPNLIYIYLKAMKLILTAILTRPSIKAEGGRCIDRDSQ